MQSSQACKGRVLLFLYLFSPATPMRVIFSEFETSNITERVLGMQMTREWRWLTTDTDKGKSCLGRISHREEKSILIQSERRDFFLLISNMLHQSKVQSPVDISNFNLKSAYQQLQMNRRPWREEITFSGGSGLKWSSINITIFLSLSPFKCREHVCLLKKQCTIRPYSSVFFQRRCADLSSQYFVCSSLTMSYQQMVYYS